MDPLQTILPAREARRESRTDGLTRQLPGADSLEMGGSDSGRENGPLPEEQEAKTFKSAIIHKSKPAARQEATQTSTSRSPSFGHHGEGEGGVSEDQATHKNITTTIKRELSAPDPTSAHFQTFLFFTLSFFVSSNLAALCI